MKYLPKTYLLPATVALVALLSTGCIGGGVPPSPPSSGYAQGSVEAGSSAIASQEQSPQVPQSSHRADTAIALINSRNYHLRGSYWAGGNDITHIRNVGKRRDGRR
jgi:hypothetical protein